MPFRLLKEYIKNNIYCTEELKIKYLCEYNKNKIY